MYPNTYIFNIIRKFTRKHARSECVASHTHAHVLYQTLRAYIHLPRISVYFLQIEILLNQSRTFILTFILPKYMLDRPPIFLCIHVFLYKISLYNTASLQLQQCFSSFRNSREMLEGLTISVQICEVVLSSAKFRKASMQKFHSRFPCAGGTVIQEFLSDSSRMYCPCYFRVIQTVRTE